MNSDEQNKHEKKKQASELGPLPVIDREAENLEDAIFIAQFNAWMDCQAKRENDGSDE